MFVRKIHNRSGSTSVQIISKEDGRYRIVKTIGTSKDAEEIKKLEIIAKEQINNPTNQDSLFFSLSETDVAVRTFVEKLSNLQIHTIGPELIFGNLFDRI